MRVFCSFLFVLFTFVSTTNASEIKKHSELNSGCSTDLEQEHIQLPTDLKLKSEAVEYLGQNPEYRSLLLSLSRIFAQLKSADEDLIDLREMVGEKSDQFYAGLDFEHHPFFSSRPELVTGPVLENYALLIQSSWHSRLNRNDLAILSFLLKDVPKNSGETNFRSRPKVSWTDLTSHEPMLRLLKSKRYRPAAAALLRSKAGQDYFLDYWNAFVVAALSKTKSKVRYVRSALTSSDLDEVANEVLRGQSNIETAALFDHFLSLISVPLGEYRLERLARYSFEILLEPEMVRRNSLEVAAHFVAEKIQVQSSMSGILELLDYDMFGTPLPMSADDLYREIVESAKRLIAPLKVAYSEHKNQLGQIRAAPSTKSAPIQYEVIDFFKPVQNVTVRAQKAVKSDDTTEASTSIENQIPPEASLRLFSSFSPPARPLSDLMPETEYLFWFLRDEIPKIQKVRLSRAAVDWIHENPEEGRDLLDSLHMGRARAEYQSGIKLLGQRSNFIRGSLYEIKIASATRGLLYLDQGVWKLVTVVNKSNLNRVAEKLKPFGDS